MAQVALKMPKLGESIIEATILKWLKKEGDTVDFEETILEIATDKVDSEVPSPVSGTIGKILFKEDDVVAIGETIALIETEEEVGEVATLVETETAEQPGRSQEQVKAPAAAQNQAQSASSAKSTAATSTDRGRFYSPLVKNIAEKEGIGAVELEQVRGTGLHGRVTKKDIVEYVRTRGIKPFQAERTIVAESKPIDAPILAAKSISGDTEIVEMDRMRRLIADHMVMSKRTSAHVTSFVEVDVTNMVNWRERHKNSFVKKHQQKITFTPLILEAVIKAISDFPMINVSVDGNNILVKKNVNVGMAAALPSGNLIVPVIKNADHHSLLGLVKSVNDLAERARNNQLKPEEIQGGTFTFTNVGTFGNVMGTPIINQPQVAILAAGAIQKKPAVVETKYGDLIAVRQMMFLSLSYDHRVVDGFLGGSFLRRIADYLEAFDENRTI